MRPVILVAEDEADGRENLCDYLTLKGYEVLAAADGAEARKLVERDGGRLALAVLDIMMPGMSGHELLKFIRMQLTTARLPVIFLTAKDGDDDEIRGLKLGADDYIRKPATLKLIHTRIEAMLRRQGMDPDGTLHVGPLALSRTTQTATLDGIPLPLTQTEFNMLLLFANHPQRAFTRAEILDRLHMEDDVFERTVDAHVKNLRLKLGHAAQMIKTFRGLGYGLSLESDAAS
jgi:two-component system phosphate regulon response regulator PhoB